MNKSTLFFLFLHLAYMHKNSNCTTFEGIKFTGKHRVILFLSVTTSHIEDTIDRVYLPTVLFSANDRQHTFARIT